jgi:hypothetical protein
MNSRALVDAGVDVPRLRAGDAQSAIAGHGLQRGYIVCLQIDVL